ncbi:hypothetical protein PHYPSEUDO_003547 [Phytophthora pseudosyringae]|uniref:Uncharacterized protein n=1 Tax=Phytophthora pseudosyringae TaxID=221518 RepID=A0A8T1VTL2_9STRA|nr:hypothetical protein PHYPSEUDO_003547 [Phytophthora pseudosyringae]
MIDPSTGDSVETETEMDDDQAAPATGSQKLTSVGSQLTAVLPASSGNAGTRSTNPVNLLTTPAAEQSVANPSPGLETQALVSRTLPRPGAPAMEGTTFELHPGIAAPSASLREASAGGALAPGAALSEAQQREYADSQVARWKSRGPGVVSPPDPYYPERRHWPMRNWLMEVTEAIRYLREINVSGDPERPWTASFKAECLCLPVISDGVPHRVDLAQLHRHDRSRDYVSVMALVQTMLREAGFAFINLVPAWGHSVSPELLASQDARSQKAGGLACAEKRFLDPAAAASFPVEEDGDVLMLTVEVQELLGNAMVIRLRLARVRPRESDSDVSRPDPKRRRGSLDAPLSIPSWPGSDEGARVWGGPVPETVGTSSLASGDAPMLTPDKNMSSAGGGSQGSPGLGPAGAVVHVFVTTAGPEGNSSKSVERPTVYIPVTAYPPTPALTALPDLSAAAEATHHDDEESKPEAPTLRESEISRSTDAEVAEHALRVANQQVADLQAAMSARDDQERSRLQAYEQAMYAQAAEQEMNRSDRKQFKSIHRGREIEEARRKEAADTEIARLQLRLYQIQEQQAQDLAASRQEVEAQVARERVASHREVKAISRDAERLRVEAAAAAVTAAARALQEETQSKRELEYRLREAHVRQVLEMERRESQEAEIKALREQVAAASVRHHPQQRSSSPTPGGGVRVGAPQPMRRQQLRRSNGRNGDVSGTADRAGATARSSVGVSSSVTPAVIAGSAPMMMPGTVTSRHPSMNAPLGGRSEEAPHSNASALPVSVNPVGAWPSVSGVPATSSVQVHAGPRGGSGYDQLASGSARIGTAPAVYPMATDPSRQLPSVSAPRISQGPVTGYPGESQGMYGPVSYGGSETYPATRASQAPGPTALPNSTSGFPARWPPAESRGYLSEIPSQATMWNSSLGGASTVPAPR